jgi:hypothetical protein
VSRGIDCRLVSGLYMHMYIFMCVHMKAYEYTNMPMYSYLYMYIHVSSLSYKHLCIYVYISIYIYIYTYIYVYSYMNICIYINILYKKCTGLDKLSETKSMVASMQEELVILQPQLVRTQAEVSSMMIEITRDKGITKLAAFISGYSLPS